MKTITPKKEKLTVSVKKSRPEMLEDKILVSAKDIEALDRAAAMGNRVAIKAIVAKIREDAEAQMPEIFKEPMAAGD